MIHLLHITPDATGITYTVRYPTPFQRVLDEILWSGQPVTLRCEDVGEAADVIAHGETTT